MFLDVPTSPSSKYKLPRWSTQFDLMRMEVAGKGGIKSQNPPIPSCIKRQGAKTGATTLPEGTGLTSHALHGHLLHICGATGPLRTDPCPTKRRPSLNEMNLPVQTPFPLLQRARDRLSLAVVGGRWPPKASSQPQSHAAPSAWSSPPLRARPEAAQRLQ